VKRAKTPSNNRFSLRRLRSPISMSKDIEPNEAEDENNFEKLKSQLIKNPLVGGLGRSTGF